MLRVEGFRVGLGGVRLRVRARGTMRTLGAQQKS